MTITVRPDGSLSSLDGKEAVNLMRIRTIMSGLKMNIETGGKMILTRGATPRRLLDMASPITGIKHYKNTLAGKTQAIEDLTAAFDKGVAAQDVVVDPR